MKKLLSFPVIIILLLIGISNTHDNTNYAPTKTIQTTTTQVSTQPLKQTVQTNQDQTLQASNKSRTS